MKKEPMVENGKRRRNPPPVASDGQPLLKLLVSHAASRGQTLASLAKALGVTYERLAQWRRGDALIQNAGKDVFVRAAQFLGLPTVLVLMFSGAVVLNDFVWPSKVSLLHRMTMELERMKQDPYLGPFFPSDLDSASPAVQLFVVFLFHEICPPKGLQNPDSRWLNALHEAFAATSVSASDFVVSRKPVDGGTSIF